MRTCVCYLLLLNMFFCLALQNVCFVGFEWCHVWFVALKIKETVGKKIKKRQR